MSCPLRAQLCGQLLHDHADRLILYARTWTRRQTDAEDIVHEGCLRFLRASTSMPLHEPIGYLCACVRSAALDWIKREGRRREREQPSGQSLTAEPLFMPLEAVDSRVAQIERALALLSPAQREVVVLRVWQELSFEAIADTMGCSINTAMSRWRYAQDHLRKTLAAEIAL